MCQKQKKHSVEVIGVYAVDMLQRHCCQRSLHLLESPAQLQLMEHNGCHLVPLLILICPQ